MAEVRIPTTTGVKAASPGLGAKDTNSIEKEVARSAADAARTSNIKAAYAREIANLKNEIATLKDRFDYT